jgi:hypothetical protein
VCVQRALRAFVPFSSAEEGLLNFAARSACCMWRSGACVTRALLQAAPRARAAAGAGGMVAPPLAAARGVCMAARPASSAVAQRAARLGAWLARPAGACVTAAHATRTCAAHTPAC